MLLVNELLSFGVDGPISVPALIGTLFLSGSLSAVFSLSHILTVRKKHSVSDIRRYLRTDILLSITVALVMLLVGVNLARAFALVGLLALTRFKSPKDGPGDHILLFVSVVIGMTCGVQYILFSIVFTICATFIVLLMNII